MKKDELGLKWGTVKFYDLVSEEALAAMERYNAIEDGSYGITDGNVVVTGAAMHHQSDAEKLALCEVIDALNCDTVYLSWDGIDVSKEEAKKYVMEYRKS